MWPVARYMRDFDVEKDDGIQCILLCTRGPSMYGSVWETIEPMAAMLQRAAPRMINASSWRRVEHLRFLVR
jgi:hypothetical protein